jgi:sensor histidine kinase YesM
MAKDPAVLFYTQDFLVGTMTMNYEQKGKYITLLCLQHQKGKLTLKDLQSFLTDEDIEIAEKFIKDTDGFYYNQKLRYEAERRKNYSESRRNNLMKKHMKKDINSHLETVTGTVTVTDTVELELVTGTKSEREDILAEVITGSLDKEQKQLLNKFDNIFGDVK